MLKVSNVRLPVGESEETLIDRFARRLKVPVGEIRQFRILRKSLDIRDKRRLEHVFTAAVELADEHAILRRGSIENITPYWHERFELPEPGPATLRHPPVIIGAGPAGLFAAYLLAEQGYDPIVLERGQPVRQRVCDVQEFDAGGPLNPESNYLFGEGGAGTFSDGKLTCRNTGPGTDRVLEIIAANKGKPSILYEARPHLGSNRLPAVVKALRRRIIEFGGEVRFGCRVDDFLVQNGQLSALETTSGRLSTEIAVLAIGHSARDTYETLVRRGVAIVPKPFQMGVRIEQPQIQVTKAQYGESSAAALLGPADYTMKVHVDECDLFTFCMCAGGYVMPSVSAHGYFCTNGMSRSWRESPFANSGLVVTVDPDRIDLRGSTGDPLIGIRYQAAIEQAAYQLAGGNYFAPIQWASDFVQGKLTADRPPSSYARGIHPFNLWQILPKSISETIAKGLPTMDDRWQGLFLRNATLVGPEARGSCPVRIIRDPETIESPSMKGLYPIGEGAGFAGGIVSAAVDGLRVAKAIIRRFQPIRR